MSDSNSFRVKDCAIITRMAGVDSALNIRELRERIASCPIECIFHHYCETVIRPSFDYPEFRNDFSIWSAISLGDRKLAEQLGILNPYVFNSLEDLRGRIIEILDERMSELQYIPSASLGSEFYFMRSVTLVFDTGKEVHSPRNLIDHIPYMSDSSLYYHFVEARRRTPESTDDFTVFFKDFDHEYESIIKALSEIDFYFMTLKELRTTLLGVLESTFRKDGEYA